MWYPFSKLDVKKTSQNFELWYLVSVVCITLSLISILVVLPKLFLFPFVSLKMWYFRTLIMVALIASVPLMLKYPNIILRKLSSLDSVVILYGVVITISSLFGIDVEHSFFGSYERMMSVTSVWHFIAFYFLMSRLLYKWRGGVVEELHLFGFRLPCMTLLSVMTIQTIIGIIQYYFGSILGGVMGGRVFGTMGNFSQFGYVCAMALLFSIFIYLHEDSGYTKKILLALAVLNAVGLFLSGSRGALLGIIFGIAFSLLIALFRQRGKAQTVVAVMLMVFAALVTILFLTPIASYIDVGPLHRITDIKNDSGPRLLVWQVAYESWKERVLFGFGYDNFSVAFNKYYDPHLLQYSLYETWFDNAHNILIEALATTGILGLSSLIALYYSVIKRIFVFVRQRGSDTSVWLVALSIIVADVSMKMFMTDHHASLLVLFFVIAYVSSHHFETSTRALSISRNVRTVIFSLSATFGVFMIIYLNILPAVANSSVRKLVSELNTTQTDTIPATLLKIWSFAGMHRLERIVFTTQYLTALSSTVLAKLPREHKTILAFNVMDMLDVIRKQNPYNPRVMMEQISFASNLADDTRYAKGSNAFIDDTFDALLRLSPKRQQFLFMRTRYLLKHKKYEPALANLEQAIALDPQVAYSYFLRGFIQYEMGNKDVAWNDVYQAYRVLHLSVDTFEHMNFISQIMLEHTYYDATFDERVVAYYARNGKVAPYKILARLFQIYDGAELFQYAYEVQQTIKTEYTKEYLNFKGYKQPPKVSVNSATLRSMYEKYVVQKNETFAPWVYEALIFALSTEGKHEEVNAIIQKRMEQSEVQDDVGLSEKYLRCIDRITSIQKTTTIPRAQCGH